MKTRVFQGPLDLLVQLITSQQLAITEVSLVDLVAEYVAYLAAMQDLDIDVTSEFLLIAATLIQLKARHLLPDDHALDLDDELALGEERDRLLFRLLSCLTFKDVAAVLAHRMDAADRYVPRTAGLGPDIEIAVPEVHLHIEPEGLAAIAELALASAGREPDLDHLDLTLPSVDAAIQDLREQMAHMVEAEFEQLTDHCSRWTDVVAYFLAVLELARWGALHVSQDHGSAPIKVEHRATGPVAELGLADLRSEWA